MKNTKLALGLSALLLSTTVSFAGVLATLNGKQITDEDIKPALAAITQGRYAQLPPQTQAQVKKMATEQYITQLLIVDEAKQKGVQNSLEYKSKLKEMMLRVETQLLGDVYMKQQFDALKVSDAELKKYFEENKARFAQAESVSARHILVKTEEEAKTLITELKTLNGKALEAKFIELAKAKSTGPSGKNGGDLGFFTKDKMVAPFSKVAFELNKGEISQKPVKTRFGFHVIYVTDKKAAQEADFAALKKQLEQNIKIEKFREYTAKTVEALKAKAKIEYK